nr:disks large homolog 5-like isoform X3 [Rattus norvegicus]
MGSRGGMFSRILSLFRRDNHIHAGTRPRQREASLPSRWRRRRMERSLRRSKSDQKASSQPSMTPVEEERMKRLENLKIALHKMQKERDELRRILADYPGKNLNDRNNFESEMLTMQHQEVMTDMKKMSEQVNRALVKCTHLTLENDWYWSEHCSRSFPRAQSRTTALRDRTVHQEH